MVPQGVKSRAHRRPVVGQEGKPRVNGRGASGCRDLFMTKPGDAIIKVSAPETGEFWPIPVLWEDARLLALDKPSGLLISPDRDRKSTRLNSSHRTISYA